MVKIKTRKKNETVQVKTKYKGDLVDIQMDMIAILADFGTITHENGVTKEDVENMIDTIADIAKKHIQYE